MHREELINLSRGILARAGYHVSQPIRMRSISFDIVARMDDQLLIVKVLSNVDAFSRENAEEMKVLSEALGASPVLIGERSSSGPLETGIVYSRFSVPIISNETLADHLLEEVPPFIFAAPGGLYVRLDKDLLRKIRDSEGLSLGTLAEVAGVSRRTIQMYETGMGAMIDAALRLEEFLQAPIIEPMNPFDFPREPLSEEHELSGEKRTESPIFNALLDLGYRVTPVSRSPFEALTRDSSKVIILTGLGSDEARLKQKAIAVGDISRISGQHSVIFVEKVKSKCFIESTALVSKDELKRLGGQEELMELVLDRSKAHD